MKKILALVTVIALATSFCSATTTLHVWTTLVSATANPDNGDNGYYDFGTTPVVRGPTMALGTYGVQIWAQVLGGSTNQGISDMAVTLYTPNTVGCFNPIGFDAGLQNPEVVTTFGTAVANFNPNQATTAYFNNALNPVNDVDAIQFIIGATTKTGHNQLGLSGPVLLATEAWTLTSLGTNGVTLGVYIAPTSRYWSTTANGKLYFTDSGGLVGDSMVIPEPITMTMLGMGLSSLGMMICRRRKETV